MKTKPLSITVIALLYCLAPLACLAFSAWVAHLPLWGEGGIFHRLGGLEGSLLLLFPAAAVGIYSVRPWGWFLFVFASLVLAGGHLWMHVTFHPHCDPRLAGVVILATTAACAAVFRRHVHSPYFNPRLRWWETPARYRIDLGLRLFNASGEIQGATLGDISVTGCYLHSPQRLINGERVWVVIGNAEAELSCAGRAVREGSGSGDGFGHGIRFAAMPNRTRHRLHRLILALEHLGGRTRQGRAPISHLPWPMGWIRLNPPLPPAMVRRLRPAAQVCKPM